MELEQGSQRTQYHHRDASRLKHCPSLMWHSTRLHSPDHTWIEAASYCSQRWGLHQSSWQLDGIRFPATSSPTHFSVKSRLSVLITYWQTVFGFVQCVRRHTCHKPLSHLPDGQIGQVRNFFISKLKTCGLKQSAVRGLLPLFRVSLSTGCFFSIALPFKKVNTIFFYIFGVFSTPIFHCSSRKNIFR